MTQQSVLAAEVVRPFGDPSRPTRSQHCLLFAVDVAGFTDRERHDQAQLAIRRALYSLLVQAFDESLIGWSQCLAEDRGDGVLVVIPAQMPSITVIDPLVPLLHAGLRRHNDDASPRERISLRAAVHIGEVHRDDHGLAGIAVNHLFRILEAPPLKDALATSGGGLGVIVSDYYHQSVLRHRPEVGDAIPFQPVAVAVKQTRTRGWMHLTVSPASGPALPGR